MLSHIRIAMHFGNIIQLRFYSQYFRGFLSPIFHKLSLTCQSFPESTCQTEYTDILGADLHDHRNGIKVKSPKQCQLKCQEVTGCNFFAWDRYNGQCWFKRSNGLHIPHLKIIIGPKFCGGSGNGGGNVLSNPHTPAPKEPCSVTVGQIPAAPCDFRQIIADNVAAKSCGY